MRIRPFAFVCFFLSGLCSLVYQIVWARLAMAQFGVNAQVISIVLSAFMFGLGFGSWAGGALYERLKERRGFSPLLWYAGAESLIGVGSITAPALFGIGRGILLNSGATDSASYLGLSGVILFVSLVPWTTAMGATLPLMLGALRELGAVEGENDFSYLYLANVLGASIGTVLSAFLLVELLGFHRVLINAGLVNGLVVALCLAVYARSGSRRAAGAPEDATAVVAPFEGSPIPFAGLVLFTTGFVSLGMEVAWTRVFTPFIGTEVYAFAGLLTIYLVATFIGSWLYRRSLSSGASVSVQAIWPLLFLTAALPVIASDARLLREGYGWTLVIFSVAPFCLLLGYLTPLLVDRYAHGRPGATGRAYAYNVLGCILGPLVAGFALLPATGAKTTILIFNGLLLALGVALLVRAGEVRTRVRRVATTWVLALAIFAGSSVWTHSFEQEIKLGYKESVVLHDYAASVVATGRGMQQQLLVNGIGMTSKTTITKMMGHVPMAMLPKRPERVLVICFGMGTTFRSLLSWDVETTVVELVPSVVDMFPFYYDDAARVMANPKGRVVVDDGRRFLDRTQETFDLVIIDPPPPMEAAGSSLLYSKEFYDAVKRRLSPDGALMAWIPSEVDAPTHYAVTNTLCASFPCVRAWRGFNGYGVHFLATFQPVPQLTSEEMALAMPPAAALDLVEWELNRSPASIFNDVLTKPVVISELAGGRPDVSTVTDDQPFNEYYLIRRLGGVPAR